MTRTRTGRRIGVVLAFAGVVSLLSLGGCYQRVVGARGLGASNTKVSKPYQENTFLDDWIYGEPIQPKTR